MGHEKACIWRLRVQNNSLPAWSQDTPAAPSPTSGPVWGWDSFSQAALWSQMCLLYFPHCPHLRSSQSWQGQAQGNEETEQGLAPQAGPGWASQVGRSES